MTPVRALRRLLNSRSLTTVSDAARWMLMLVVLKYRNVEGVAFPSVPVLQADSAWGERKVRDTLAELRRVGFFEPLRRGGGPTRRGTAYLVHLPTWIDDVEREQRLSNSGGQGAGDARQTPTPSDANSGARGAAASQGTPALSRANSGAPGPNSGALPHELRRHACQQNSAEQQQRPDGEQEDHAQRAPAAGGSQGVGHDATPRTGPTVDFPAAGDDLIGCERGAAQAVEELATSRTRPDSEARTEAAAGTKASNGLEQCGTMLAPGDPEYGFAAQRLLCEGGVDDYDAAQLAALAYPLAWYESCGRALRGGRVSNPGGWAREYLRRCNQRGGPVRRENG